MTLFGRAGLTPGEPAPLRSGRCFLQRMPPAKAAEGA